MNDIDVLIDRARKAADAPSVRTSLALLITTLANALEDVTREPPLCEHCGDIHVQPGCHIADAEWEYAVARELWPTTPVYRQRNLEAAQAFVSNPTLGSERDGWLIIKRVSAGPWEKVSDF